MRRRVVPVLCFTQLTGWGVLFYAFPVLQGGIAADTGWSATTVAGAFTAGQVVAALGGVAVGRILDRRGPRIVMSAGSAVAVASLVVVAEARSGPVFVLGWLLAGASMAAVLYPPAFAAVTGWSSGDHRLRALTVLTVAGGLASTVFAPVAAWLHGELGWRSTYLLLAGVLAVTLPAHWWGLAGSWPGAPARHVQQAPRPRGVLLSRSFLALTGALAITGLCSTAVVVNLVPLLQERGLPLGTASLLLALGGLGQVVGRIGYGPVARRLSAVGRAVTVLGVLALTTGLLGVVEAAYAVAVVVLLAGAARGCLTLLRATAVPDRWGTSHYAQLTGVLSLPVALAAAAAPWVGAQLAASLGSHARSFLVLAALNALAVVVVRWSVPARPPAARPLPVSRPAAARR